MATSSIVGGIPPAVDPKDATQKASGPVIPATAAATPQRR